MASETVFFSADPARPRPCWVDGGHAVQIANGVRTRGVFGNLVVDIDRCDKFSRSQLRALTDLRHKNIVLSFAFHMSDSDTLKIFSQHHEPLQRLEAPRTSLHQIASGLSYLHANSIVHGDLQPYNIVVDENERVLIHGCGAALCCNGPGAASADDIWDFGRIAFWLWRLELPLEACSNKLLHASCMGEMIAACIKSKADSRPTIDEIKIQLKSHPTDFMV